MEIFSDEFGYIKVDDIKKYISSIQDSTERCSELERLLKNNISSIKRSLDFTEKIKNNSINKEEEKNDLVFKNLKQSNDITFTNNVNVDYYFDMITNCKSEELDDLLLNVIIPNDLLYAVLARLQKEYTSYYKMQEQFEKDGDKSSVLDCQLEMYNIITIIDHLKDFDSIKDDDLDNLVETPPVNNLVYLTIGDKNLPFEDISKIPIEYYSGISKLLTGMSYGRFNKIKSLYDRNLLQISDGLRIRIYFQHIKDNNFLVAGVYLYTSNGKDKSSKIFIDKRDALSREFINKYNNENTNDDHAKVLELLNNRGGY